MEKEKMHKKIGYAVILLLILEVPDLALDWDFYVEVMNSNQTDIKNATEAQISILAFFIVGSVTFTIETVNLFLLIFCDGCTYFLPGCFSLLSTLIEDIPQMALALYIAIIEETTITNVQFGKAGFAVFEVFLRTAILIYYIHKKNQRLEKGIMFDTLIDSIKEKKWVAVVQLTFSIIILSCSISIFYFLIN
ncbi:hypothetical protein FSP39_002065 [Pinctada imbricata]|uniref:Uncharacterized protein n=1 Tax=Pinctada imbricata TaxID=66713 RepID=A0AA89CBT3_PINIB|nr:hypothetical protein FSP39_002065 [Pinctada imbricata]